MTATQMESHCPSDSSEQGGQDAGVHSRLPRIGLALSGGGFRAALFHLGAIRRLEEIGVMKYVDTISAVSGGAIIASYYQLIMKEELAKRLTQDPKNCKDCERDINKHRMEIYDKIHCAFVRNIVYSNIRSRSLLFGLFYYPHRFLRALFIRTYSRSDLVEHEFEKRFFQGSTLASLYYENAPSQLAWTKCSTGTLVPKGVRWQDVGPKVAINATSLIRGRLRTFVPFSQAKAHARSTPELAQVNAVRLSKIVGASMAVPGVFSPRVILGDQLVDGGVLDNQGIEYLIKADPPCQIIIVSDASGQLKAIHRNLRYWKVLRRALNLTLYKVAKGKSDKLKLWKSSGINRLDILSDIYCSRQIEHSLPRDLVEEIVALRTDLDQFGCVETEALIYHGYACIDSALRSCQGLADIHSIFENVNCDPDKSSNNLGEVFPLMYNIQTKAAQTKSPHRAVKKILSYGRFNLLVYRACRRYPLRVGLGFGLELILTALGLAVFVGEVGPWIMRVVCALSGSVGLAVLCLFFVPFILYLLSWLGFVRLGRLVKRLDKNEYNELVCSHDGTSELTDSE